MKDLIEKATLLMMKEETRQGDAQNIEQDIQANLFPASLVASMEDDTPLFV